MYVPAWPLPGNGYVTLIPNGSVTMNISTAKIDRGINIYPATPGNQLVGIKYVSSLYSFFPVNIYGLSTR
jgi:hypothetical protein